MKKCPECGNPSYDGAPVCGNCGYKFPKPKVAAPKSEDIFQQEPKKKKTSDNENTVNIIKKNKLVIGAILIITLIVIFGIVLTGSNNNTNANSTLPLQSSDLLEYSAGEFTFKYPENWKEVNLTDADYEGAVFFQNEDNATIEYYQVPSESSSIKEITQGIISYAQGNGDYVETVETVTLDGRNSSNVLLENANGDYTRYVSMFSDGQTYVFKITGDSVNTVTSEDINSTINSADIA